MEIRKYNKNKIIALIISYLLVALISFYAGKKSVKITEKVKTEYIKGDVVIDTLFKAEPSQEYKMPDDKTLVQYCIEHNLLNFLKPKNTTDTFYKTEYIKDLVQRDTSKILND